VSVLRLGFFGTSLAVVLAACGAREAPPADGLVDDLGHPVALAGPAQRIVSLSPSTTELLFAIGAGGSVVGRTRWCDFPPEAATVPSVGDGLYPNLELVLSRKPDLVVFYASAANQGVITRLEGLGLAAASVRLDRLDDLPRAARLLGRLTGATARADSLATRFAAGLDSARAAQKAPAPLGSHERGQRVAVVAWDNPPIVIGRGSFLTELIELAGARNVFDDLAQPSAQTGIEAIAAREPDVLLTLGEGVPAFARRPEWQNVGAVRRRSLVAVQGSEFERPTFRSLEAVRTLRAALSRGPAR
jgi:ABC-type Fe3+-hydroxamate transport system substrate-binding protein